MREIEFRGMDLQGRWFYGNLAIIPKDTANHKAGHCISNSAGMPFAYRVRPETVGQYTGLKDRNKKEIYEGDIVESSHRIHDLGRVTKNVIEFNDYCWRLVAVGDGMIANAPLGLYAREPDSIVVVGNIYETAVMDS